MGLDGEESGNDCGERNNYGEESRKVLSDFGPKKGDKWRLLSSVGKEDEWLERWRARGTIWSAIVGKENGSQIKGRLPGFSLFLAKGRGVAVLREKKNWFWVFYL